MHHRQNSLIHSNRLVEVKQQRRNWKHTSAFWLKRAYMWHVKAWWGRPMWLLFASLPQSRLQRAVCFGKLSAEWVINQSKNAWVRRGHSIGGRRIPDVGAEWKTRTEGKCRMWGPYKNCVHGEKEGKKPNKKPTSAPVLLFEYKIKGQAKVNKCTSTKEANTVVALHLRRFYSLCTCWNLFRIFRKN